MRVAGIDKMIAQLELLEKVDDDSEYFKNRAIAYLKDFADYLDEKNIKTIKVKSVQRIGPFEHSKKIKKIVRNKVILTRQ